MKGQHVARCASEKNPAWPIWYVERNGLNVMTTGRIYGGKLDLRDRCETEASRLNAGASQ